MPGSTPATPGRIFISYRRQETAYPAAWLYERVAAHFGPEQVFKDVDSIQLGDDFAEVIANAVGSCDVLLALIGDRWLTITDEDGRRRLDDPDDFVRLEIETALERNIRVIPVLFEGARLPRTADLPTSLAKLVRRQALELAPSRFDADIGKLLRVLDTTLAEDQARREEAAKAARQAEEQARREAEAQASREAEEQAREEAEERKLSAIDAIAQELRSGNPSAMASAEGALRRLANDASHRVAQRATNVLGSWQAEAQAEREAQAKAQLETEAQAARETEEQAGREAKRRKLSAIEVMANDLRSGDPAAVVSAVEALRRLAQDANQRVAQAASSVLTDWEAEEQARQEAEAQASREAEEQARREADEQARLQAEAKAVREAEEQARGEDRDQQPARSPAEQARTEAAGRRPYEVEQIGQHLHSESPQAEALAKGALQQPTSQARPRVARPASPVSKSLPGRRVGSHRGYRIDRASFRVAALAIALVLVISGGYLAFTNRQDRDSGGSGGAVGGARNMATVKIGLIAPLTGALAELGLGMRNSVDLAIREANAKQTIQGYKLVLAAKDDAATPATGANVAKKLAADPLVAGVVGTLNSSVAQAVAPLLASANIVQISPVNTLDTLTRGVSHRAAPKRVWPTYFRVNSRDAFQGLFGADYAYTQAGFRTVVVIHDTEPYGRDLAKDFARRFQSKGGKVVGTLTVRQGATDFQTEANKVVDLNPDMVFYGGEYPEGGPLTRQLKARGFKGAVMGGDGLYAADFFKGADDKGEGTLVTVAGEPVERLDTASQFVNDYEAVGFKEGYGAYGAQSFDTANILIQALAKALPNAENVDAARPQIVKAVGETNGFKGVTGEISFDEYGDIVNQAFTVYRAKGSDWLPVFSGKFEP